MQLITSQDTLNFLSKVAPRAWVKRMLIWRIFDEGLEAYFKEGRILGQNTAFSYLAKINSYQHDMPQSDVNKLILENFDTELANRLMDVSPFDFVDDDAVEWGQNEDPHQISAGFFLYADVVDWENGALAGTISPTLTGNEEYLFWDSEEHLNGEYDPVHWIVELKGLCFKRDVIEMMLPTMDLVADPLPSLRSSVRSNIGRPPKWDWEGAMAHIVSIAQHPDGLPLGDGAQAQIESMFADWFFSKTGNSPATSQIRQRAQIIMASVKKD